MRWQIETPKRSIVTTDMEGHEESLEMSGEQVSGIISYSARDGLVYFKRQFVFPMFRIQPNNTHGSFAVTDDAPEALFDEAEKFVSAKINGTLVINSFVNGAAIKRTFYPSTTIEAFYETVEISAEKHAVTPRWNSVRRINTCHGCEGVIYAECYADAEPKTIPAGETFCVTFKNTVRFANGVVKSETNALEKRLRRVEQLISECDLTTGNEVIDTMFAFAKIRSGESLFRTRKGLVHCPGGKAYYAAVWCNDQCEYAAPWFAYTADKLCLEASRTAFEWFEPFMGDNYKSIPSSIIAEGFDNFGCAGDRGDVSMYLYGLSRFYLTAGGIPVDKVKILNWCVEFIRRNITDQCVVFSDSDELENRISSGINLSTSSLAYGGLINSAILYKRLNLLSKAKDVLHIADTIRNGIENYFGANIDGFDTYRYHEGCNVVRAWNALPLYMGIDERKDDTIRSIEERLWTKDGCRSTEKENIVWDRSALYFMATLFRLGEAEDGWNKLTQYSAMRLLGERVPYAVEAYPEGDRRHLSAESALYCRIIVDGLLNVCYDENGFGVNVNLPKRLQNLTLRKIFIDGKLRDIIVKDGIAQVKISK